MTVYQRKRKLMAFFVLAMLLYGHHGSVSWTSATSCVITTSKFASAIGVPSVKVRSSVEWLARYRYVTDLTIGHNVIELTVRHPVERGVAA